MKLKVSVFEYLNQKVMYIQDVNYYFGIRDNFDIKLGDYELSEEEVLNIAKENDRRIRGFYKYKYRRTLE